MMRRRIGGVNDTITNRELKRSRIDVDHLGFRLLDHGQQQYYLGIPEPPRAPEPYKISGGSSSMARAHRRSSFVILAESGQITSKSVGGSPIHERIIRSPTSPNRTIHGRSSPFRPRGFKGPLPRAQSRLPSPPPPIQRRFIQPTKQSLSQGNSPRKQSLIPQPYTGLSVNRVKEAKISDREKWERRSGRHVTTRIPRSSSIKAPQSKRIIEPTTRGITKPMVKSMAVNSNKTKVATFNVEKKVNRSPTKIPIRHTPNGRFIQIANVQKEKKEAEIVIPKMPINLTPLPTTPLTDDSTTSATINNDITSSLINNSKQTDENSDDPGLVDLLKQSSGGSGTSSVVNATTTTAVQPLHIDPAKILPHDIDKIQNMRKDEKLLLKRDTSEIKSEIGTNENIVKNNDEKNEKNSESIQSIETVAEPMNVKAVIETVRNDDINDIKLDKSKKDNKNEVIEMKNVMKLKANDKPEKSGTNSNVINSSIINQSIEIKHESNEPNPSNESPPIKSQNKLQNHGSETSLKSFNGLSTGSVESIRSTDTGVSLNTVRGLSSAREKRGTHVVKRIQEIETLSGNVMNFENQHNGEPASIRWKSKIAPVETTSCCHPDRSCGLLCKSCRNWCCRLPSCCTCRHEPERNNSIRAKHSLTSVAPPPLSEEHKSKIPDVLIEHNSVMRGAIPCLPVPLAWFCLIWNVLIPGSGTVWSGLFNLCIGQPRFSATATIKSRIGALIVDIIVGVSQLFTVLFCLVGWGWSIWWGVTMIRVARKWKRFKVAEATNSDAEARGNDGILPAPGVPAQNLRGIERAR